MIDDYKVIVITPAGRKRYLQILVEYVKRLKGIVDEYHIWLNTEDKDDVEYIKSLASDYIKVIEKPGPYHNNGIYRFFPYCIQPKTVYVRFDDDIVFLDDNEAFINFVKYRIAHPEYFLLYSNIINNSIISHLHHRLGNFNDKKGLATYDCMCKTGWGSGEFAENVHRQFLSKKPEEFYFDKFELDDYERVSINCISWLGEEFQKFNGLVDPDEEGWLATYKPAMIRKKNCIYGKFVCAHYAFFTQREYLSKTDILERYKKLL